MTRRFLSCVVVIALLSPLGACLQEPSTPEQAQWLATLRSCPPGSVPESSPIGTGGYRCIPG
jgi:hypothetical protein